MWWCIANAHNAFDEPMCAIDGNVGGTSRKTMYKTHANYKIDITAERKSARTVNCAGGDVLHIHKIFMYMWYRIRILYINRL
jgi:hypothetical protein